MGDNNEPPHCRLFILCSKSVDYDELRDAFSKYGNIEDIWIVKDKTTGEPKGVVYITFSKTSDAALAAEEMRGKTLESSPKPLKIMVAHSRSQGSIKKEYDQELVRLFIVVPKTATEEEIREVFEEYGKVDSVNIVKNRETGESKGFAYVKYIRPYCAAKAFEECNPNYRAVFAKPREQPKQSQSQYESHDRYSTNNIPVPVNSYVPGGGMNMGDNGMWGGYPDSDRGGPPMRLVAWVTTSIRDTMVYRLFDLVPGLQVCRPMHDPRASQFCGQQKVIVQYGSAQATQHALEKLNGFEYPPGHRIVVKAEGGGPPPPPTTTTISSSELATLTSALAKAESIIKAAGLSMGAGGGGIVGPGPIISEDSGEREPSFCSVALPPPQPPANRDAVDRPSERLFVVCQPGLPPIYALRDVFGRFPGLIEVHVINGKNCGYVSYENKQSAERAIELLHLQEVCGMRLKVMKAEPPRSIHERKRVRMDTDDS